MDNSFLNGIVSSALAAQDIQDGNSSGFVSEESFTGITEKDGYVGEMVKASLAIFEGKKPEDYGRKFDSKYTVILSSLKATVSGTDMEVEVNMESMDSVQDIIDYVSEQISLDLDRIQAGYDPSKNKIIMTQESAYGPVEIEVGVDAYETVEANKVLGLPRI